MPHAMLAELRVLPFTPAEGNQLSLHNHCKCAGGLLAAVGGGFGAMVGGSVSASDPKTGLVRVWRVDDGNEAEIRTLNFLAPADSVTVSVNGGLIAVGTRDGVVHIISTGSWATRVMLGVTSTVSNANMILSLAFSNSGAVLVAGRHTDVFDVFDCKTSAPINSFVQEESAAGTACCFFANDSDMVATGGGSQGSYTLHATKPFCVLSMKPRQTKVPLIISNSAISPEVLLALSSGSFLQIFKGLGAKTVVDVDLGSEIALRYGHNSALLWRPDGKQLACGLQSKAFTFFTVDGTRVFDKTYQRNYLV